LIFAAVMLCIGAVAAEAGYVIAPYTDSEIPYSAAFSTLITYTDEYATVISTGDLNEGHTGDLYFVIKEELDTSYEWIKMRIRNHSDAENFEFHFASSGTGGKVTAESCTHFPISAKDSEFKEYIFNIKQCNAATNGADSAWTGKATQLRFDCMWIAEPSGQMPKGSQMDIDYIAFFKSEEDAKAFAAPKKVLKEQVDYSDVVWDKNSPHFIFDNEEEISKWLLHDATASFELGNLKYVPQGTDPTLARNFDTPFSTKEYPYIAYRFKAIGQPTSGAIFFTSDKVTRFTSNFFHTFDMGKPGQWVNLVMDMNNIRVGTWEGNITSLRLDAINGPMDENSAVYINRIGFFKSEAEAYSFLSEGPGENFDIISYIESDSAKAIIPGGTLSEGYNENEYLLSGEAVDNAVVSYTDANGASSIVALGYTNEYGHTTYVANKAGKYALGTNNKEYTDISSHWGKEYIDFVSQRALFGGTSPTEFSPDMAMTRGMFITVLGRMHGVDTAKYMTDTGYTDVPAAEYYAPYIKWAKDEGIMAGTSDTTFAPETPITRADMAVAIKNYTENSCFAFTVYAETEGFNELAVLDET
ncbi:MAG: S-layer homology domain-containing protein, partial [Clostridia bacterium]|nr:S-layer homology domain-containing protein [Clostridia bacterium]